MKDIKKISNNLKLPIIVAPMFLISTPEMVIECCKNGVIGSFPALNQRTCEGFENWLKQITTALNENDAPYAVNLIVNKVNARLEDDLELCIKYKVPIIITSLGINPDLITAIHNYGGEIFHDITTIKHAKKAADAGVDGIIAVAAGAGGHAGTLSPFALVNEIREFFDGTLILAGSISNGKNIRAAEIMGADFAYMGTRFINTEESAASNEYKDMINTSSSANIIYTAAVSGVPANFMAQSLEKAGINMDKKDNEKSSLKDLNDEAKAWKNIWSAGHGVGTIKDITTTKILIQNLKKEYENE
jgi:nitronate monooxygenase